MMIRSEYTTVQFDGISTVSTQHLALESYTRNLNHEAIAPVLHQPQRNAIAKASSMLTVVAIFPNKAEAQNAILEMKNQGLPSSQILIIAQEYQEHENSINWEYVGVDGGLVVFLTEMGIDVPDTFEFVSAVEFGKFLVLAVVTDRSANQAQYLLENIGRKVIAVY